MNTVNSCGETCAVCAAPLGGVATCDSTGCGSRCDQAGARACGTACVACPSDGVQLTGCEGNACVALSCKSAYLLRNGLCVPAWTIAKVVNKVVSSPLLTLSASGAPALAWVDEAFSSQAWVNGAKVPLTVERPAAIGFAPTGELLVLGRRASGAQWWIALETVGTPGSVIVSDGDTDPFGIDATATQTLAVGRVGLETKLFTRSSTAWVSEKVTGPSKGASVVVAADHSIWVLTDQGTSATLSRRVGSEWSHQALSATYLPTLAVKPDSAPVVAWGLKGPGFVVSNGTTQETVPLAGLYIADVAVATDAKGFVHVAVNAATSLRYSTNRSGSWVTEIVSRDMPANTPAIAVAANGQVHIAWTSFADSGLYSAVRSE